VTVASTVGLVVGQPVSGTNVAAGTKIASINTDGTTFTIDNNPAPGAIPAGTTLTLSGAASTYSPVSPCLTLFGLETSPSRGRRR